ncbi:MAG: YihY/virulence factor BrkB family protein [Oligoflexia bacterium]|nr:YihY/virulence factor BrkB family protein [Oligoflexia bacterium]
MFGPIKRIDQLRQKSIKFWKILCLTIKKFIEIEGSLQAEAFAYNAFFSLLPLIILFVTIASYFIDRERAGKDVITYMESYVPISGKMQLYVFNTIADVIKVREKVGMLALLAIIWSASRCFITLISASNHAWDAKIDSWWWPQLKSFVFLFITANAVLFGMALPVLIQMARTSLFSLNNFSSWIYSLVSFFLQFFGVFLSLCLFYKLAPHRTTRFAEVWVASLCATLLLQATETLFIIYLNNWATLNAVYGAFGGIIALLLWIYLAGCIFIFGACLSAAQSEVLLVPVKTTVVT